MSLLNLLDGSQQLWPTTLFVGLFLFMIIGGACVRMWVLYTNTYPYPPGPRPRMLVGNLYDIPTATTWVTYTEWARKYGNIVHVKAFSQHFIIINSLKDATELLQSRARIYSDRPLITMINLMGWDFNAGLMPYADRWRRHRKVFHQNFGRDASLEYRPIQARKINDMLQSLLASPEDFMTHYKTVAAAIVMSAMYGHDISAKNDYFVSLAEEAVVKMSESLVPGAAMVNVFPILRHIPSWFPGARFKRFAEEGKKLTDDMQDVPFNFVRKNMNAGIESPGLLAKLLARNDARGGSVEDEGVIKRVTATSYAAGADTTFAVLGTFAYAMACNPRVQKKAQEEIDSFVGTHRLPSYDDRASLPYIEALYRELLRWRPVFPLGAPRSTTEDDVYQGYFIPKGTIIYSNVWAMTRDEAVYKDPELFFPERYFNENGDLNDDQVMMTFGFGRRICVGRHMASATIWLAIVSMLSTFDITLAKDSTGKEIPIPGDYSDGLICHPLPFQCSIKPRSSETEKLVLEAGKGEC